MNCAIVLLVLVIGTSIRAQEWAFQPIGMGSNVNQFDNSRTPIRQISAIESSPSFWNMPMVPTPQNDFAQSAAANNFGQASPLYSAATPPQHRTTDACCTSPTTVQMAKDIAESLKVLRALAASLETLHVNSNRTMSTTQPVPDDKLKSSDTFNAETIVSSSGPPTVAENIPSE